MAWRSAVASVVLIYLAVVAQLADWLTFGLAVDRYGVSMESNPVIQVVYSATGFLGVGVFKGLFVGLVFLIALWYSSVGATGWSTLLFVLLFLVGVLGAAANVWAVLL